MVGLFTAHTSTTSTSKRRKLQHLATLTATTTVAALSLFLSGCSAGHTAVQTGRVASDDSAVIALTAAPATLDFTKSGGAAIPQALIGNVYEGLVRISSQGDIEPQLATSWDLSPDRTTYTFHLRKGVHFSNGDEFTADTAKFSIDRVKSDAWTNGLKAGMKPVTRTQAVDKYTLAVTLSAPSNGWLWSMGTLIGAQMTPRGVDNLATKPVGTGPFTVDEYKVGRFLTLSANKSYWGQQPATRHVALRYMTDSTATANALRSGDVDAIVGMDAPEMVSSFRDNNRYAVDVGTTTGKVLLTMNNKRAPFNDVRVRRAVMYAINRQAVIDTAWGGFGEDTGGVPAPPTDPWSYHSTEYPYDPDRARQLLAEAGVHDVDITFTVPARAYATNAAELIISELEDVGIHAHIESQEFPAVWLSQTLTQHDYDMSIIEHAEARDIPTLFGNPDYYLGYDDEQTRTLLSAADSAPPDEYAPLMRKAVDRIMNQAGANTIFIYPNIVVRDKYLTGIPTTIAGQGLELAGISRAHHSTARSES